MKFYSLETKYFHGKIDISPCVVILFRIYKGLTNDQSLLFLLLIDVHVCCLQGCIQKTTFFNWLTHRFLITTYSWLTIRSNTRIYFTIIVIAMSTDIHICSLCSNFVFYVLKPNILRVPSNSEIRSTWVSDVPLSFLFISRMRLSIFLCVASISLSPFDSFSSVSFLLSLYFFRSFFFFLFDHSVRIVSIDGL